MGESPADPRRNQDRDRNSYYRWILTDTENDIRETRNEIEELLRVELRLNLRKVNQIIAGLMTNRRNRAILRDDEARFDSPNYLRDLTILREVLITYRINLLRRIENYRSNKENINPRPDDRPGDDDDDIDRIGMIVPLREIKRNRQF